ncbi:MAG: hypothetical protein IJ174_00320 [Clostridia bacterium]|nr:hypothetical protein [Clostridia bacterium]
MYDQNFGTCRGCGKQIIWTRTPAGKNMPCDPCLITFTEDAKGPETFILPDGQTKRGRQAENGERGYIPHWATCPNWKQFKRKGEKS